MRRLLCSFIAAAMLIPVTPTPYVREPEPEMEVVETIGIMAVGDVLLHPSVWKSGHPEGGPYDNSHMFKHILDDLAEADVKILNQETVFVKDPEQYSGYPKFGSPMCVGDAEVAAGFNVITHATNHTLDKGVEGLRETLEYWTNRDVLVTGIFGSEEGSKVTPTISVNGVDVAVLNYTYGLNGLKLPSDCSYMVNLLSNRSKMIEDIRKANEVADVVIVCPHWGIEYQYTPSSEQKKLAQLFADSGADIIIGTHSHVLQPVEMLTTADGRQVLCYYSLGNYISAQDEVPRMLGGMAKIEVFVADGVVSFGDYKLEPLVTHRVSGGKYTTYHLEDYTESMASKHWLTTYKGKDLTVSGFWDLYNTIMNE